MLSPQTRAGNFDTTREPNTKTYVFFFFLIRVLGLALSGSGLNQVPARPGYYSGLAGTCQTH
jgi:hypothetical protein